MKKSREAEENLDKTKAAAKQFEGLEKASAETKPNP